jgi:hypothetical protein
VKGVLERYRPHVLCLERFDRRTGQRASRVAKLCQSVTALAQQLSIEVRNISRGEIRDAFGLPASATRQEVAEIVAHQIEALRHRLPHDRRPWESPDRRMALFCAAALVLTARRTA